MHTNILIAVITLIFVLGSAPFAKADPDSVLGALIDAARMAPTTLYEGTTKTYGNGRMSPDVLKNCLILAHQIDRTNDATSAKKSRIRNLDERIQEAGPRLSKQAEKALTDQAARAEYAQQVKSYNAWVDQRLTYVKDHNRGVLEYAEIAKRFDAECNGRAYFPSDLRAVAGDLPPEIAARLK